MQKNKGFTLIELMIVIAIIAIIAAIAIPNLVQSRVRANEATAISGLKQIATAQVTFQIGRQGRTAATTSGGATGYCDNYRNLAFGTPVGGGSAEKLSLVSDVVANAAHNMGNGGGTTASVTGKAGYLATAAPYQGYLFSSGPAVTWTADFACYAVPNVPGTSGNNAYWLGQQGTVYMSGLPAAAAAPATGAGILAATATPQTPTTMSANWTML